MSEIVQKIHAGFQTISVNENIRAIALKNIQEWLEEEEFIEYREQLLFLIENKYWDYLLDCFYQVIPFGTGWRRGEVGIGPNRINPLTIRSSAQGHSQYLISHYGNAAKERWIVFAYDVRHFYGNKYLSLDIPSPVKELDGRKLAEEAAQVYSANGIPVFLFTEPRSTPELSFAIRHLKTLSGIVFSASHNPPDHNWAKIYDEYGGQLIPPADEALVTEVTQNVGTIKSISLEEAKSQRLFRVIGVEVDKAYIHAASWVSVWDNRNAKILYSPLHWCGVTSVYEVLKNMGFDITLDEKTQNMSGRFEHVTFNIPNPEVTQSFETTIPSAETISADIILNSDPDADRIGVMVRHNNQWIFIDGNQIAILLTAYLSTKSSHVEQPIVIKTWVTTNLIQRICEKNNIEIKGDLLVGFKYIGDIMNTLEKSGRIDDFLFGCEESHGYLGGNYARDKDAVSGAIWISDFAWELKNKGKTLIDALEEIYREYGYFRNYLTEIRMLGATGRQNIEKIQSSLRKDPPKSFWKYEIISRHDYWDDLPIVSETDRSSKDMLVYDLKPFPGISSIKVTIRPSGTEPKTKIYIELGTEPVGGDNLPEIRAMVEEKRIDIEKTVMQECFRLIGIEFPERGFLLFWQLPVESKLLYFEKENLIENLKDENDSEVKKKKLAEILSFLWSDPLKKINIAFEKKHGINIEKYLKIDWL